MTAQTFSAKQVAREVAKRTGRDFDAKRVRAWVRENVAAYDDDGYTAHQYDRPTFDRIVKALVARSQSSRTSAASKGRAGTPASKAHSAPSKAKTPRTARVMGTGPVPRNGGAETAEASK